jgi:hypothetical protein
MRRIVEPELLDALPANDPSAIHSRLDLRRLNRWMRNQRHLLNAIGKLQRQPASILELGSGDGTFMLSLARGLQRKWREPVHLYLLDMEPVISRETIAGFAALGWRAEIIRANLGDWLQTRTLAQIDLTIANLFLHHFEDDDLRKIFASLALMTCSFAACEPRRWRPGLLATRLIWAIGCNQVTRHDAYVSVRAGFSGKELSALWPVNEMARQEHPAGYASHIFTVGN